ncbi:hypothetical protein DEO72_LG2g3806 [Vigna unguiculata]|uniref:Uncharacterized protein n=1 Tax=Vigna unguiculata TaxID=3917 RepID=A0A4D6L4K5_VIGUN|nr:hypothetical protein DEO72_LG2g3806 [Vigna unguiculata]
MEVLLSCVAMEGGSNRWHCSLHLVRRSRWHDDGGPHLDVRSRFAQIKCRLWICVDGKRCKCCLGGCRSRGCCGALLRRNVWTTSGFVLTAGGGSWCFCCRSYCSAVVHCGEEDENVVAGKFAFDKGGGCHGDGER